MEKKKSWFRRHWILTGLLGFILLIIIITSFGSDSSNNNRISGNSEKTSGYSLSDCLDICEEVYDIETQVSVCQGNCWDFDDPSDSLDKYVNTVKGIKDKNSDSNEDNTQEILDPLDASVTPVRGSFIEYQVLNINDYAWHNVLITVNEEYDCWGRDVLEPGEKIIIRAAMCDDFVVYNDAIYFIKIEADEGWAKYASQ